MAIKNKLAKPAKKSPPKKPAKQALKKHAAPKKSAPKAVAKKAPAKKTAKPVVKKIIASKKPVHAKPLPKKAPVIAIKTVASKQPVSKPLPPVKKLEHKHEIKGPVHTPIRHEVKKPAQPAKPVKVVIPEIKTKTVRKYEPEFTKSVLDTYQQELTGPTMRYSDAELAEFKDLIIKKLDAAKKELTYLQGLITRKDEMGGDDTDNRYMTMEDGSMSMEREQLSQMASRQITFIDHLEKALMRIENKTYGICRVTGKLIDKARLRAVPHATLSIEAKQTMNK
ncbi:MAG: TraR/DksA family transcriptional regulator [Chitinophagales bacterium]